MNDQCVTGPHDPDTFHAVMLIPSFPETTRTTEVGGMGEEGDDVAIVVDFTPANVIGPCVESIHAPLDTRHTIATTITETVAGGEGNQAMSMVISDEIRETYQAHRAILQQMAAALEGEGYPSLNQLDQMVEEMGVMWDVELWAGAFPDPSNPTPNPMASLLASQPVAGPAMLTCRWKMDDVERGDVRGVSCVNDLVDITVGSLVSVLMNSEEAMQTLATNLIIDWKILSGEINGD